MDNIFRLHPQPAFNFNGLVIDNFAGGGGASTGIELGLGRPVDIAVNHDPEAVAMHDINHPHTKHFCESVWEVDPRVIVDGRPVDRERRQPTPVHTGPAPEGATHIGKESGSFYRPDDENHLVQVYRRGRWIGEAMHTSNLLVSSSFITVRGAPPRAQPAEQSPTASPVAPQKQQQQMFDFGTSAEDAA